MKTYRMMFQRMMMTALLLMMVVTAMGATQTIKIGIIGNGSVAISVGGTAVTLTDGVGTVSNQENQTVTLTMTPGTGFEVGSVTTQKTVSAGAATARRTAGASFLTVTKVSDNVYSFEMPDEDYNVYLTATFTKSGGGQSESVTAAGYSGVYYICSGKDRTTAGASTNYYLCPTENWYYFVAPNDYTDTNNGMPFMTTYQCRDGDYDARKAIWTVEKHPTSDYYYFKHAIDGYYLTHNIKMKRNAGANRMRIHLEENPSEDDALFSIESNGTAVNISVKNAPDNNIYLNVNKANKNYLTGKDNAENGISLGGIIGVWKDKTDYSLWYLEKASVDAPTITNNFDGTFTITAETGATIYYTTNGDTPTASTVNTGTSSIIVHQTDDLTVIKAIAKGTNDAFPSVVTTYNLPVCEKPQITVVGNTVTITSSTPDATIRYTLNDTQVTSSSFVYEQPFDKGSATVIRAIATKSGYVNSSEANHTPPQFVHSSDDINRMNGIYILADDFTSSGSIGTSDNPFMGTIDGKMITLSGLTHALVAYADGATIKNVFLDNVHISGGINVGAICNEAVGSTRIYNCGVLATGSIVEKDDDGYDKLTSCSSTISGSGYVGGIVGLLDGSSRVINCFSYANITGGSDVGGIVGHNNVATTATNLKTMVMNCMFYGEITGGSSKAPIYNGEIITNVGNAVGVSNFNYFRLEAEYIKNENIEKVYNCALGAETRFLQRFEFFRHLLNSNRKLAAWWATGNAANKDEMMKWVMEPDQIGTTIPYPILKTPGKYASVVNYTPNETAYDGANRNKGRKLTGEGDGGVLHVTIQMGDGAVFNRPSAATITTSSVDLPITDKDFEHFNYNYGKVQLPYYNDYGTQNYKDGRVVTGWKITSITGTGTTGYSTGVYDVTYDTNGDLTATPYNFADRNCTDKDFYGTGGSNRIFNQGAYWDVPIGVTAITIEPYWGKAVYLADEYLDIVYATDMKTAYKVTTVGGGQVYKNGESLFNGQKVYTTMANAVTALSPNNSNTVNDYAVVLVGNYHQYNGIEGGSKPYTVTSVDLDNDNEPDYSFVLRFDGRTGFHPLKYDFLNLIGLGMAQKSTGGTGSYNFGIMQPKGWFEVTNTALFRVTQFEYSPSGRVKKPYILQGGVIEQWVTQQQDAGDAVEYFHVGGNVWFKEFHRGSHQDNTGKSTPHPPVSVTGGDFDKFYLTGLYQSQATIYDDNAECYINGGRFGEVAGAGMEGIGTSDGKGNITWVIDHADIKEFYGGGINYDKPVHGNIHTIINNSYVDIFCGGPKFGDMLSGRTVMTKAEGSTFGKYFGAGYGGNAYNRYAPSNQNNKMNIDWNAWVRGQYTQTYSSTYKGVSTQIDYQFIPMSGNADNVCRLFVDYVGFSLATTHDVTSSLTGCTITSDFYGGGSLGKVVGDVISTLTDCTVEGNVFGAGFSGTRPTVEVDSIGFRTEPYYYTDLGTYRTGVKGATTTYTWEHGNAISIDKTNHILYTTEDLTSLGTVSGKVTLNIEGNTLVKGNVTEEGETTQSGGVFGGGDASAALGDTELNFNASGQKSEGYNSYNVFGGGNKADVGGKVTVNMKNGVVAHDIYGGGALANTNTENWVSNTLTPQYKEVTLEVGTSLVGYYTKSGDVYVAATGTAESGVKYYKLTNTTIYLTGGTVNGDVYGGGLGNETTAALVYGDVEVILDGTKMKTGHTTGENPVLNAGRVFGANNINGTPKGHVKVLAQKTAGIEGQAIDVAAVFGGGNLAPYQPSGTTDYAEVEINMTSGSGSRLVIGDVFGGGNQAGIEAGTQVNIMAGDVKTGVYGGCNIEGTVFGDATVTVSGGNIGHGSIDPATKVFSYTSKANVHGGGYGNDTYVKGDVVVNIGAAKTTSNEVTTGEGDEATTTTVTTTTYEGTAVIYGDVYGGGALGHVNAEKNTAGTMPTFIAAKKTTVNLNKGIVYGDAYGGGLGIKDPQNTANEVPAYVGGDVTVNQREVAFYINKGTYARITKTAEGTTTETVEYPQTGRIFGCNNANGSPQGEVTVNVYKTVGLTASGGIASTKPEIGSAYELAAVYGGGNLAAYEPAGSANKTNVNIDGCDDVSIKQVYGGGNAAPTPATYVEVNGCYDIDEVFGGGNGYDYYFIDGKTYINPGANVGYKTYTHLDDDGTGAADNPYNPVENDNAKTAADRQNASNGYVYGTGIAEVAIYGGTIRAVYGGSNEKGNIRYQAKSLYDDGGECTMSVKEKYGGGKNSNFDGEILLNLGCTQDNDVVYGGSKNADVNSDIVLNITNGTYKKVFGGNNTSGAVNGSITVNIKETGCSPIIIEELYLGGYLAPYSVYGYEKDGEGNYVTNVLKDKDGNDVLDDDGNVIRQPIPLLNGSDPKPAPRINIISASRIDNIYGGGYQATVVGDPHVNVNMEQGMIEAKYVRDSESNPFISEHTDADGKLLWKGESIEKDEDDKVVKGILAIGYIGNIYGGGNEANIVGNTYVEIGTGQWLNSADKIETEDASGEKYTYEAKTAGTWKWYDKDGTEVTTAPVPVRKAAKITGNVFGGGNGLSTDITLGSVSGNTYVTIGDGTANENLYVQGSVYGGGNLGSVGLYTSHDSDITFPEGTGLCNVTITGGTIGPETPDPNKTKGNVFGAGKGEADTFECMKAMVSGTNVTITNGLVRGTVYGGGEVGRVENNTVVTIGQASETSNPVVNGDVFGAGKGVNTHGYSALVRGKTTVTVQGGAKVGESVYGGGEIASVGRYKVKKGPNNPADAPEWVLNGMPYSLKDPTSESGKCVVIIQGNAEIGPDDMQMKKSSGDPDDTGHVFGAGKGVLPYEGVTGSPWRMAPGNVNEQYTDAYYTQTYGADYKEKGHDYEADYLQFIETLALATETDVTISGNAFVKGSVYGGSLSGHVQHDTRVTVEGGQIGNGEGVNRRYTADEWASASLTPCAHWEYVANGAPYDPLASATGTYDYTAYSFVKADDQLTSSVGGRPTGTDGHTYYGNVFGGGSGVIPYAPGKWHRASGSVGGDTYLTITGGHILTNVYGGNEQTDVGTYAKNDPTTPATGGKCTIEMSGGTVGVPLADKQAYPVTGHLFGAGKGDKRVLFNTWTNVANTEVNVTGGTIYGNVYGGGEDGHVIGLAETTISEADATNHPTVIGTNGDSGFDGDVFGGGQGSVSALTAGVVGGNVNLNILGGTIKNDVYGGGRIASVGTFFADATDTEHYGKMQDGDSHGVIRVNLIGGTILHNVYGGCMGTTELDDEGNPQGDLGVSKNVNLNLNGVDNSSDEATLALYTSWGLVKDATIAGTPYVVNDASKGCIVKGGLFGCNNVYSSPQGEVKVHVYKTQREGASRITNSGEVKNAKVLASQSESGDYDLSSFDVRAVYGGGNLAAYLPGDGKNTEKSTSVVIDGCDRTSIGQVYGGGNAASTPGTQVTVNGTFEIGDVFGGGNGKDQIQKDGVWVANPGANVGYYAYPDDLDYEARNSSEYTYGKGEAHVEVYGGTIHAVYGGSNTKGNVRVAAVAMLDGETDQSCEFHVDEAYGGGKSADMDGKAILELKCIKGLSEIYGGAKNADVNNDVMLNLTNGTYDQVFGGNNVGGRINGKIVVNIEETGCNPVIIGELYGGGNRACYSVYGYQAKTDEEGETVTDSDGKTVWLPLQSGSDPKADPVVNVKSFTSIGNVYGGGYGESAVMVASPRVYVDEVYGRWYDQDQSVYAGTDKLIDGDVVTIPAHAKGKIGAIQNVYGGGNAAQVIGDTYVNIGTKATVDFETGIGTAEAQKKVPVVGVDIRGNVYGGGNQANVTGKTNVTIGK